MRNRTSDIFHQTSWPQLPEEIEVAKKLLSKLEDDSGMKKLLQKRLDELNGKQNDKLGEKHDQT